MLLKLNARRRDWLSEWFAKTAEIASGIPVAQGIEVAGRHEKSGSEHERFEQAIGSAVLCVSVAKTAALEIERFPGPAVFENEAHLFARDFVWLNQCGKRFAGNSSGHEGVRQKIQLRTDKLIAAAEIFGVGMPSFVQIFAVQAIKAERLIQNDGGSEGHGKKLNGHIKEN